MNSLSRRNFVTRGITGATGMMLTAGGVAQARSNTLSNVNIKKFGAVGNGKTLNTESIQKAIDACASQGGGQVVIPKGTFLCGSLTLQSNIDLHLEEGAILLGSPYMKDYQPRTLLRPARYAKYLQYALLFAQGKENVTVSGKGTLNGNGQLGGELGEFEEKGSAAAKRPCLLWFDECQNILIQAITYVNSGMWTETYTRCRNIHVNNITVKENYFFNADGCNIVDSEEFVIENCDINTMDDGICLKAYTNNGVRNGIIRNNKVRSICNGIKMGTDSSGGFRNITIENNEVWHTGISGIALEMTDGGIMENITVRNITMNVVATPIFIMLSNRNRKTRGELTVPKGIIQNVFIRDIKAVVDKYETYNELEKKHFDFIPYASSITGFPDHYVRDVVIENVDIQIKGGFPERTAEESLREIPEAGRRYPENRMFGVLPAYGFFVRHARDVRMKNVNISMEQADGRPAFFLEDTHESNFEDIEVNAVTPTPAFSVKAGCESNRIDLG